MSIRLSYGDLIHPDKFTIEFSWGVFRKHVIPPDAPVVQVHEMKKAYLAGFAEAFKVFIDYSESLDEETACRLFDRLTDETNQIVDRLLALEGFKP